MHAQDASDCVVDLPSRLIPAANATIIAPDGLALYAQPFQESVTVADLERDTTFKVWFGSVCIDNALWWLAIVDGTMGWLTESVGENDAYLIEPNGEFEPDLPIRPRAGDNPLLVDEQGLQFSLSANIARTADVRWVAANESELNPGNFAYPAHREVTFEGYIGSEQEFWLYIRVHPADEWEQYTELSLDDLRAMLDERTDSPLLIGLPLFGAGRAFEVRSKYIDFQNGSGVRSLVQYSQSGAPPVDGNLIYLFSGMTDDQTYVLHIAFALDSALLPDSDTMMQQFDFDAFGDYGLESFSPSMISLLSTAPDETFRPRLSDLDILIESLMVDDFELCGAVPSVLKVGDTVRQVLDNSPLRVRDAANGQTIESFLPSEEAVVIDGPICIDGVVWWQVIRLDHWAGWVAELQDDAYYLERVDN